jgi:two-component system cell cycle sensor histidine kinase/response regulator CckA
MARTSGRLLLVDDEPALLKLMKVYLTRRGYSVDAVASTEEAWARVEADPSGYAVAILDGSMSGMPSTELAVRMMDASPALRVIATSGYPADLSGIHEATPERSVFLPKPFTPEMLASLVEKMLAAQEEGV